MLSFLRKRLAIIDLFEGCDWSRYISGASASPRPFTNKMGMSPSSTVHGGHHDTRYATFELLMLAAFVAGEIWGCMPEPACSYRSSFWARLGSSCSFYT